MRKTMIAVGLAFAAGIAGAQSSATGTARDDRPRREQRVQGQDARGERDGGGRRRGGPGGGGLLRGITLTDAQKAQIKAQREQNAPQAKAQREAQREQFGAILRDERAARERGDSAGVQAARDRARQLRAQSEPQRQQEIASLRSILTADQQKQLDANVAKMKERGEGRGGRKGK